jgi:hypothetical protein
MERKKNAYTALIGELQKSPRRPRRRMEDNITWVLKKYFIRLLTGQGPAAG